MSHQNNLIPLDERGCFVERMKNRHGALLVHEVLSEDISRLSQARPLPTSTAMAVINARAETLKHRLTQNL